MLRHALPMLSALLAVSASTVAATDRVRVIANPPTLLHEAPDAAAAAAATTTSAGLAQLAMDTLGLPTGHLDGLTASDAPRLQADVFRHADALAFVYVDAADAVVLDGLKGGAAYAVAPSGGLTKLPGVVAQQLRNGVGSMALHCAGSSRVCAPGALTATAVADTAAVDRVFADHKFLNRREPADVTFAEELARAATLTAKLSADAKTATTALAAVEFSSTQGLAAANREQAQAAIARQVADLLAALAKAFHASAAQVFALDAATATAGSSQQLHTVDAIVSYSRMLLGFSDVSASGSDEDSEDASDLAAKTNGTSEVTLDDIAEYQIVLWTSVLLGAALLLVIMAMCNMDTKRDSLLYAKFITGGSGGRKYD